MSRDWDADLDHIRKDLDKLSLSQQISYLGKSVDSWDAWHPAWEQYLTFKIQQTPSSVMETKDKGFYPIEIALDNMLNTLNGKGELQLDPIKTIWHVVRIIEGKTNGDIMRNSKIVQKFINNGYKPGFKGFDESDFQQFSERNYDKLAAEAEAAAAKAKAEAEAAAAKAKAEAEAAAKAKAEADEHEFIKDQIDALPMSEQVTIVGIVNPKYNAWPEWHDYVVRGIGDYILDHGNNQKQMGGYLDYLVQSLASDSSRNPEEIGLRPNGILEMWSVVKMFAESIKDKETIKKSKFVQEFIQNGLKKPFPYKGVPETEFAEFVKTNKAGLLSGFFGGRKSRKQNKSRKQGKSKKQRKSRK